MYLNKIVDKLNLTLVLCVQFKYNLKADIGSKIMVWNRDKTLHSKYTLLSRIAHDNCHKSGFRLGCSKWTHNLLILNTRLKFNKFQNTLIQTCFPSLH